MKLPEPYLYYSDCVTFTTEFVNDFLGTDEGLEKIYSEAQLRAEIEKRDAVLREVLDSLNRYCVKRQDFDRFADDIKAIQEILK